MYYFIQPETVSFVESQAELIVEQPDRLVSTTNPMAASANRALSFDFICLLTFRKDELNHQQAPKQAVARKLTIHSSSEPTKKPAAQSERVLEFGGRRWT